MVEQHKLNVDAHPVYRYPPFRAEKIGWVWAVLNSLDYNSAHFPDCPGKIFASTEEEAQEAAKILNSKYGKNSI